jgi:hemin uptake protein HemP
MSGQTGGKETPDDSGGRPQETPPTVPTQPAPAAQPGSAVRHVRSADLFGGAREVVIEHEHHRYRLKMTSRGGLILNK